jgi:hypothetical protein
MASIYIKIRLCYKPHFKEYLFMEIYVVRFQQNESVTVPFSL